MLSSPRSFVSLLAIGDGATQSTCSSILWRSRLPSSRCKSASERPCTPYGPVPDPSSSYTARSIHLTFSSSPSPANRTIFFGLPVFAEIVTGPELLLLGSFPSVRGSRTIAFVFGCGCDLTLGEPFRTDLSASANGSQSIGWATSGVDAVIARAGAGSTGFGIRRKDGNLGFGLAEKKDASALTSFTTGAVEAVVFVAEGGFAPGIGFTPFGVFAALGVGLDPAPVPRATFFVGPGLLAGSVAFRFLDAFASAGMAHKSGSGSSRARSGVRTKVLFRSTKQFPPPCLNLRGHITNRCQPPSVSCLIPIDSWSARERRDDMTKICVWVGSKVLRGRRVPSCGIRFSAPEYSPRYGFRAWLQAP